MKKKMLLRGVLGIPLGISISYVISIITSFIYGNGKFFVCSPLLIEYAGNEINAVVLQTVLSALLGMIFAGGSVVWDMEQWSIAKQTGIYFTLTAVAMFPISYMAGWMEHTLLDCVIYFGIFVVIFVVMWLIQYFIWKQKIERINKNIHKS
ncbi:DUF3021 domain-containing protein [Longibaculum muris]|uniref:DUF3021 family protein n=1 Tax=Longibaculum muris TaxID=1796628 RepID=A0A4R3Z4B7_9FIRM|nr:DUF3021 domain-containing protein [Longibaculum muris]KXU49947.1 hypothetical protein HMPREF3037_01449 [Candidatus Stoquefichus sp. KLE1796]MBS5368090.1 DUF3021 domain-containing protein [Coprobacillus cateniformis]MCR1887502.1 DUF3021 domain-containing protein [Longibaculum muris]TCW00781.1 DUF3021 family protein [Longibaculum muris]